MAQRISRAKLRIRDEGVTFALPAPDERAERLRVVEQVLYLIFNEGYAASSGEALSRADLTDEAIRLGRLLHQALPEDAEVAGLLALMLLTDARRPARTGPAARSSRSPSRTAPAGAPSSIDEGVALVTGALPKGPIGPYQLQAAIAAVHDEAARAEDTDWPQILALYACSSRSGRTRWSRSTGPSRWRRCEGPAAALDLLATLEADAAHREPPPVPHGAGPPARAARRHRCGHRRLPDRGRLSTSRPERRHLEAPRPGGLTRPPPKRFCVRIRGLARRNGVEGPMP